MVTRVKGTVFVRAVHVVALPVLDGVTWKFAGRLVHVVGAVLPHDILGWREGNSGPVIDVERMHNVGREYSLVARVCRRFDA